MSLVAYAASSDDESDSEVESVRTPAPNGLNGHISDDDEYGDPISTTEKPQIPVPARKLLHLPAPSSLAEDEPVETTEDRVIPSFEKLPEPKKYDLAVNEVIEEDDEFLHKKETGPILEKPPVRTKAPVRITIPALSDFKDLDVSKKASIKPGPSTAVRSSGLLSLLPRPKNEAVFAKSNEKPNAQTMKSVTSLIPDSVKNQAKKPPLSNPLKPQPVKKPLVAASDSDCSDNEDGGGDFFSLNAEHKLPEVSVNEINAMVAKKAAQMAQATSKIDELINGKPDTAEMESDDAASAYDEMHPSTSQQQVQFDERAMHALVGSRGKRRKIDEVNIVELSTNQVLPDKDEWLRSALASTTSYQATGVLTDEEPAPGTRKKHQITYLAHQAKANEQELQAMWSANRHTRRQTQGKYGF